MPSSAGRSRLAVWLLAGSVLAGACAADGDDVTVATSSTTSAPDAPGTLDNVPLDTVPLDTAPSDLSSGEEAGAGAAEPGGRPAVPTAPSTSPGDAVAAPAPGVATTPSSVAAMTPAGPVGSLAGRYLRPDESAQVLVQVLAQDGAAPRAATPERVRTTLTRVTGKPVELAFAAVEGGSRQWTGDELRALADRASPDPTPDRAVVALLFLRGGFAENERAVGVAVRGDIAAVFAERVDEAAGVLGNRAAVEEAVTVHEVGHLLGLVDLVLDTGRQDPEHPGHSPNRGSVMYHAVESTLLGSLLTGGPPRDFDQADLDDLDRIRNG